MYLINRLTICGDDITRSSNLKNSQKLWIFNKRGALRNTACVPNTKYNKSNGISDRMSSWIRVYFKHIIYIHLFLHLLTHLKLQLSHIISTRQIFIAHPKSFVQIHYPMLDEDHVNAVHNVSADVHGDPLISVGGRLKWKRRSQRNYPGVVQKCQRHHA